MTVSTTANRKSYNCNGATTEFSFPYYFLAEDDLTVILVDTTTSPNTETTLTKTTHYTVDGEGDPAGGSVTTVSTYSSDYQIVIIRQPDETQTLDLVENDPLPAENVEQAFDRTVMLIQQLSDKISRSIVLSDGDTSGADLTMPSPQALALLGWNSDADALENLSEIGDYQGNWATSTVYTERDLAKDSSNNNIYRCNTGHTSSGTTPISSNADVAKWDLLVDTAGATAAQAAAEAAQVAAETAETNAETAQAAAEAAQTAAETAQSNAETAETNAETAQTAAEAAQTATEAVYDSFDDRYLGAKASDPALDNDGDALITGALYFNTTSGDMKVYNGAAWEVAYVPSSGYLVAANNLSDVSNVATAQQNLDLEPGVDVQAYDPYTTKNNVKNAFTKTQIWAKGADVASASSLTVGDDGNYFDVTGTTAITSIATVGVGAQVKLHFDAALTLTHHTTDLILPGGANITTAAGDEAEFIEYATGDWRCTSYTKASGEAVVSSGGGAWELISATTISSPVSSVDFTDLGGYKMLRFSFDLKPATDDADLYLRVSTDNGSTFLASSYMYDVDVNNGGGSSYDTQSGDSTKFLLSSSSRGVGNSTNEMAIGHAEIYNFNVAAYSAIFAHGAYVDLASGFLRYEGIGGIANATARNAIRLLFDNGNIASGTVILEGYVG